MEDDFMLSWIGFINAGASLEFFQREFPQRASVIERTEEAHKEYREKLVDLIEKLGDEKCRELIGGGMFAILQRRMKE